MEQLKRFKKAVEYLKTKAPKATNESVSRFLRYKTDSYISDVIGGSKPITPFLLERMVEKSINREWIETGEGEMLLPNAPSSNDEAVCIEIKTASGKTLRIIPEGGNDINILNAFLEERDRLLEERNRVIEKIETEKQARIDDLIKEKDNLNEIVHKFLSEIHTNSKQTADHLAELGNEIRVEHRVMMDTMDKAAKQPIGTSRAKAGNVELIVQKEHVSKGKQAGVGKQD